MDNLEFRKFLTVYGINYEEYKDMTDKEKQELINKFNEEKKNEAHAEKIDDLEKVGKGLQGCGCLLILLPILAILLFVLFSILF